MHLIKLLLRLLWLCLVPFVFHFRRPLHELGQRTYESEDLVNPEKVSSNQPTYEDKHPPARDPPVRGLANQKDRNRNQARALQ